MKRVCAHDVMEIQLLGETAPPYVEFPLMDEGWGRMECRFCCPPPLLASFDRIFNGRCLGSWNNEDNFPLRLVKFTLIFDIMAYGTSNLYSVQRFQSSSSHRLDTNNHSLLISRTCRCSRNNIPSRTSLSRPSCCIDAVSNDSLTALPLRSPPTSFFAASIIPSTRTHRLKVLCMRPTGDGAVFDRQESKMFAWRPSA